MHSSLADRLAFCKNAIAKKLVHIMLEKKTNLSVAADLTEAEVILSLAKKIGSEICVLKTHVDIIADFDEAFISELRKIADDYQFLIFEDRKFADIGNTVKLQYHQGIYHIAEWADIINAHIIPGPGIVAGLQSGQSKTRESGLLLLAQMSSQGALTDDDYAKHALKMAHDFPEFVFGFIAQKRLDDTPYHFYFTPGVKMQLGSDSLGQQYLSPQQAVKNGADIIIVGRGIYEAKDPAMAARQYREAGMGL